MSNNSTKPPIDEGSTNAEIERLNAPPAFQFYVKDWLAQPALAALNHEEFGFLIRLICFLWLEENLIFDEKILARLMHVTPKKFQILFAPMKTFFKIEAGFLYCPQLEEERRKQANWRAKSSIGGQKSAEARRKGGSNLVATVVQPNGNSSSSSSSSSSTTTSSARKQQQPAPAEKSLSSSDLPKSIHSLETTKEYVLACQANGQKIKTPAGLAITLNQTGKADEEISNFLSNGKTISSIAGKNNLSAEESDSANEDALARIGARPKRS